ncbi:MAG: tetratricopeptide repeat protein [Betaproteobacteria bacterium]|nr:tetratricopeptide repeat protein [Betaproteobacteria bacterium]
MSLLLEALKKAELAKQGSARAAGEAQPSPPQSVPGLALEAEPERAEPVFTREKLPDITQPLEILSEDLPSAQRETEEEPAARRRASMAETASEPAPAAPASAADDFMPQPQAAMGDAREAARRLFEAKEEVNYNPKLPFYITLAVLGLTGAGYAGYVWWQMQPRYAYSAAAIQGAAKAAPSPQAAQGPAPPTPQAQALPPGTAGQPLPPEPRPAPRAPQAVPELAAAPAPAAPGAPALRRGGSGPAQATSGSIPAGAQRPGAGARRAVPPISVIPPAAVPDAILERAWEDYQRGNIAAARAGYQQMLEREPNNRDALLGLAAVEVRMRNNGAAEARYQRLLELDPRDSLAQAGLIGLRGQLDPMQSESRLKTLLAGQPEATHLYFTLGNQYALQNRWPEAQQAYFRAYSADPENADYAFNLAVSLDQMQQKKAALEYYQRALALAEWHPTSFERAQVSARIQELQQH